MKTTLRYERCEYDEGYKRVGVPFDENYLQGAGGRAIAHDFIEHPKGYPTGTLEDEIAAFGAIISIRLQDIGNPFTGFADRAIAAELKEMFDYYREGVPHKDILKPRRRCHKYVTYEMELVAEQITECPTLRKRLEAWFGYGYCKLLRRFGDVGTAYTLFYDVTYAVENCYEDSFALRIDTNNHIVETLNYYIDEHTGRSYYYD